VSEFILSHHDYHIICKFLLATTMMEHSNNTSGEVVEMEGANHKPEDPTIETDMKGLHGPNDVAPDGGWAAWGSVIGLFCCSYVDLMATCELN
jgi:hypothetical protein